MSKTRKQRAGGKYHPSLPSLKKASRFGAVRHVPALAIQTKTPAINKAKSGTYGKKPAPNLKHTLKTLTISRNNSTSEYIKSIKILLHKTNEILREPTEDYDIALEISEQLKKELNELEESFGAKQTDLTGETPPEEVVERVITLIDKYKKPKSSVLIAVTVDVAVTNAKAAGAPAAENAKAAGAPAAENANVGELTAMLGSLKPFRA